jgi:hypothetical protein
MQIGMTARDKYTGFTGLVTGKVQYLTGCTQFLLQPHALNEEDGKPAEPVWLDEDRIEAVPAETVGAGSPGGPQKEPGKR